MWTVLAMWKYVYRFTHAHDVTFHSMNHIFTESDNHLNVSSPFFFLLDVVKMLWKLKNLEWWLSISVDNTLGSLLTSLLAQNMDLTHPLGVQHSYCKYFMTGRPLKIHVDRSVQKYNETLRITNITLNQLLNKYMYSYRLNYQKGLAFWTLGKLKHDIISIFWQLNLFFVNSFFHNVLLLPPHKRINKSKPMSSF